VLMGQVLTPPDDTRVGATPVRMVAVPSGLWVPSADVGAEQQVISVAGVDGSVATVSPTGYLRASPEPEAQFNDPFDGVIDTLDRWNTAGTNLPTANGGILTVSPGATTPSASSALSSKPTFPPIGMNYQRFGLVARFESVGAGLGLALAGNSHRFWGLASIPGTWQATIGTVGTSGPILDGVGFEVGVDGLLYPVLYTSGARTVGVITGGGPSLNASRSLANGNWHQFAIIFRTDAIYWFVDTFVQPAAMLAYAAVNFTPPAIQTLPIRLHSINSTSAPAATPTLQFSAVAVGNSGDNSTSITDGQLPYRRARVADPSLISGALAYGPNERSAGMALNVNTNAIQVPTYRATVKPAAAKLTANTLSLRVALHHTAASTKTVRIRRITVSGLMDNVIEASIIELHRITAAPTGTVVPNGAGSATATAANVPHDTRDVSPEAVLSNSLTAATSAGLTCSAFLAYGAVAAAHGGGCEVYDWPESSQEKPITLRAGVLEGIAVGIISTAAVTPTLTVEIDYTEEG
jgi:hypothetical protein